MTIDPTTALTPYLRQIGFLAGTITVAGFLPQVIRAWRTRQTRDLSLGSFALIITASTLWIVYGVTARDWPVIATNVGMGGLNLMLLVAKLRFG
jgi:MtN3 and saliva related transmembrane protein